MEYTAKQAALTLAKKGHRVFTLATNHEPHKGTHGYKDATTNQFTIMRWFNDDSKSNLGLALDNMLVLDIDRHNAKTDGVESLKRAGIDLTELFQGPYRVESTPRNGFHVFMRYKGQLKRSRMFILPGVELISNFITIAPSKKYQIIKPIKFERCAEVPASISNLIERCESQNKSDTAVLKDTSVKYTGKVINEMLDGTTEGNRNIFLAKQGGRLLWNGVTSNHTLLMMRFINDECFDVPLDEKEVLTVFNSLIKKQQAKVSG